MIIIINCGFATVGYIVGFMACLVRDWLVSSQGCICGLLTLFDLDNGGGLSVRVGEMVGL